jgi:hypothetical protein
LQRPPQQLDRSRELTARDPAPDVTSRVLLSASRLHPALIGISAPAHPARWSAQSSTTRIVMTRVRWERPMEFIERTDDGPAPISIARCRELLGEEAESMTDQEIALIRRHAETMACIVVEMYQEDCQITE